jgi:hypothetical protein
MHALCSMLKLTEFAAVTRIWMKVRATNPNPRCKLQCQKGSFKRFLGGGVYGTNEPGVRCAFNHFTDQKTEFREWAKAQLEQDPIARCDGCDLEARARSLLKDRARLLK